MGQGGAIKVQQAAQTWMKNNLNIDLDELPAIEERVNTRYSDPRAKTANIGAK